METPERRPSVEESEDNLVAFLTENEKPQSEEQSSEEEVTDTEEVQDEEETSEETQEKEETSEEETPSQYNAEELISKNESGEELSSEEIEFLKSEGYEISEKEDEQPELPEWTKDIQKAFPDREFKGIDDYNSAVSESIESLNTRLDAELKANQSITEIFENVPESAELIRELNKNGGSLKAALISIGITGEDLEASEGDEDYDKVVDAKVERKLKDKQRKEQEDQRKANEEQSKSEIEAWQKEEGISEDEKIQVLNQADELISDLLNMKITRKTLNKLRRAMNYDKDVQSASQRGEVRGLNKKITIQKKKKKGDGLPKLNGSGAKVSKPEGDPFVKMLDEVLASEKRTKR